MSSLMTIVHNLAETSCTSSDPMYSNPRRRKKTKSTGKPSSPAAQNMAIVTNQMSNSSQHDFDSTRADTPSEPTYAALKTDLESRYNNHTSPRRGSKS